MSLGKVHGQIVDVALLPEKFPTHRHEAAFWESLGRAVATFGFLEEVLGKAIFSFTATRPYQEAEIQQAYVEWLPKLKRALSDPLWGLVDEYERSVQNYPHALVPNLDELLKSLRKASKIRNVLCHASWGVPNEKGASIPLFVTRQGDAFESEVDLAFIDQVQRNATELACAVVNSVTQMGWQFPGSNGPGDKIC